MAERPRILVLDLLESLARERDMDVRLERNHDRGAWTCALMVNRVGPTFRGGGNAAREAIRTRQAGRRRATDLIPLMKRLEGVQPDVCGSETIIRPSSYDAVIEDAPQEHSSWAPAAPAHDATTNSAAATDSFPRVCAKPPPSSSSKRF